MVRTTDPVTKSPSETPSGMVRTTSPKTSMPPTPPKGTQRSVSIPKEVIFAKEYIIDLNATRAAKAAGYSPRSAHVIGHKLLKKDKVRRLIQEEMNKRCGRLEVTADHVLQELARIAFLDPRQLFDEDGDLKPISELDDDTAAALASFEIKENFKGRGKWQFDFLTKKVKLVDKKGTLELLGKHLKLFTDKHEHAGPNGEPLQTGQSTVIVLPAKTEVA